MALPNRPPVLPPCTGRADLFGSLDKADHYIARRICADCPVIDWCRGELRKAQKMTTRWKDGAPEGTWAGVLIKSKGSIR